jgi:hypothetical protein
MNNPKPEHRISFLERQFLAMGGNLEALQEDNQLIRDDLKQGFAQAHAYVRDNVEARLDRVEGKLDQILKLLQQKSGD